MANIIYQSLQSGLENAYLNGGVGLASSGPAVNQDDPGLIYSTSELNDPEYSTDDFRMFSFKVARCSKRYVHDWRSCPFAHPTENARRRDPRTTRYLPVPCPDYKRGICMRGDSCPYSHGVYECWLHPAKYRTQLCKEGPACRRPVCFFAHTVGDLRQPTHLWSNSTVASDDPATAAKLVVAQDQPNGNSIEAQRSDSETVSRLQSAAEEAFNNMQDQSVSDSQPSSSSAFADAVNVSNSPPRSPWGTTKGNLRQDSTPLSPAFVSELHTVRQEDSNNDSVTTAKAAVAAAAASAAASRTSLDNNMQMRAASAAARTQAPSWSQGLAASATAAAALAGVPVNEQPLLPHHGPRMSNAVARKLGLAPTKSESTTPTAAMASVRRDSITSPQRRSLDTMGQQQQNFQGSTSLDDFRVGFGTNDGVHGSAPLPISGNAIPVLNEINGYPASYPGADALAIHPALLNLVAANMSATASNSSASTVNSNGMTQVFGYGSHSRQQETYGLPNNGQVATLLGHMSQWGLSDSNGDSSVHSSLNSGSYPHRGSSDGMLGMSGLPGNQAYLSMSLEALPTTVGNDVNAGSWLNDE